MTRDRSFYVTLFAIAVPMILQNIISVSVGVADNIMVGSLGDVSIAGVALANQIQTLLQMLMLGIGAATVLLAAQYWGKGDVKSVKDIIAIGIKISLLISISAGILVFFFPKVALRIFTPNVSIIDEGSKYLRVMALSYVFFCITFTMIAAMRCVENVLIALIISIVTLIVDVGLNYALIFGNFGAPKLGITGAAVATLIARILETCIILYYIRFVDKKLKIRFKELLGVNLTLLKDYVTHGFPVISGDIMWGVAGAAQTMIIGRLSAEAVAANSISMTLFSFVTVIVFSTSGAAAVIIGKTVGAAKYEEVKEYARTLQIIFLCLGLLTSLSLFTLKGFFISLYAISPEAKVIANQFLTILSVSVIGTSYHAPCFTGIIRAGGDTKFVLIVDQTIMWCLIIPVSFTAAFILQLPPVYVFFCLKFDQMFKWIIAFIKTNRFTWIKNLTREMT